MSSNTQASSLSKTLHDFDGSALSDAERAEVVMDLRTALRKVETPWQRLQELIWENSAHAAALKIGKDLNLFTAWSQNPVENRDVRELAGIVNSCDVDLLDRVLRTLAFKGTLDSPSPNRYSLNAFSKSLSEPSTAACLDYWFGFQIPALTNLPAFLKSTSYKMPTDSTSTAWNYAIKNPTPFFDYLQQNPEEMAIFASAVERYSASQTPWVDLYPAERLLEGESSPNPVLVDIGGGLGHDLVKFVDRHNPPSGSCYLQDRPEVIEKTLVPPQVNTKPIDFFKEAPVKGARAYYLHSILHDWRDDQCRTILSNIKSAMDKDVSRILIHEVVRMEDGSDDLGSVGEFTVMALLGSPERSEKQWRNLIESAGLQVKAIHSKPLSFQYILEVVI